MREPRSPSPRVLQALSRVTGCDMAGTGQGLPREVVRQIADLSRRFTRRQAVLPACYLDDPGWCRAYLAYFLPVNLVKVQMLLDELVPVLALQQDRDVRILDLGSGPGTALLAVADWLHQQVLGEGVRGEYHAVDQSGGALDACRRLWAAYQAVGCGEHVTLRTHRQDIARLKKLLTESGPTAFPFDLIIVQNVLGELFSTSRDPDRRRCELLVEAFGRLREDGTVMIIEPALRTSSRQLHRLRDALLATGVCTVYSPCLHDRPCPALANPGDWCHEERPWGQPRWIRSVDRHIGLIKDALKFSYLLLRRDGKTIVERTTDVARVVSDVRMMKGENRAWLCHEGGRPEVGRLDRERSAGNAAFDHWHRGAIVRISEIVRKERQGGEANIGRIPRSATVEIIRPV